MLSKVPAGLIKPAELKAGLQWYSDTHCDLYVWRKLNGEVMRFQFTYNKGTGREEIVEWSGGDVVGHALVDPGDDHPRTNRTPIIVANGVWDRGTVAEEFEEAAKGIDPEIFQFVLDRLAGGRGGAARSSARTKRKLPTSKDEGERAAVAQSPLKSVAEREKEIRIQGKIRRRK